MSMDDNLSVSIQIKDFEIMPKEITQILSLQPSEEHVKGEVYFSGPKHNTIEKVYKSNYWEYSLEFTLGKDTWAQQVVDQFILEILLPRKECFMRIKDNCSLMFCISGYYYNTSNPTYHFNRRVIEFLGDLGMSLDIDQYCTAASSSEQV
jgi:Domain of unknown function (DUF4279)